MARLPEMPPLQNVGPVVDPEVMRELHAAFRAPAFIHDEMWMDTLDYREAELRLYKLMEKFPTGGSKDDHS